MYIEYIEFAVRAKEHVKRVQEALFSIECYLGKCNKEANNYVNIFRAELIRRALIHDNDKCEDVVIINGNKVPFQFAEYTVGSDYFFSKGGDNMKYDSEEYLKTRSDAYAGLNALDNHRKVNDHHPEYYKDYKKDMKLIQLMEMVCDWRGTTAYATEDPTAKFLEDSAKNIRKYEFNSYQKFVIGLARDFLATGDTRLIDIIFKGCTNYDNDFIPRCTSDVEVQFYRELYDFLKERIDSLAQAKARRSKAWRTL